MWLHVAGSGHLPHWKSTLPSQSKPLWTFTGQQPPPSPILCHTTSPLRLDGIVAYTLVTLNLFIYSFASLFSVFPPPIWVYQGSKCVSIFSATESSGLDKEPGPLMPESWRQTQWMPHEWMTGVVKSGVQDLASEDDAQLGSGTFFMASGGSETSLSLHFLVCQVGTLMTAASVYWVPATCCALC